MEGTGTDEFSIAGKPLSRHIKIAQFLHLVEKSSVFYLLAFINRKFSSEFFKHVVYGKLRMREVARMLRRILSVCRPTSPPEPSSPVKYLFAEMTMIWENSAPACRRIVAQFPGLEEDQPCRKP